MAGHSKWSNIKHKKGKADAQRGKIFTKIGREIAMAVKEGGGDPEQNSKLRDVIAKAKASNMPNDNISRSIKKASGELGNVNYEEISYEGYGPGGVAVIVEIITDNRNRTAGEIRHAFSKNGGNLGTTGSVGYLFDAKGILVVEKKETLDEEEFMMMALEAGAEDIEDIDEAFEIITSPEDFPQVRDDLEAKGIEFLSAEVEKVPQNVIEIADEETITKFEKMIDMLEDNDDVQNVFHNGELPEEE